MVRDAESLPISESRVLESRVPRRALSGPPSALDAHAAAIEANRCLFCFDAPCTAACPTHIDVPRFIKKIASGNLRGSALTILDANILGLSCCACLPGGCAVRRRLRDGARQPQAHRDRPPAALCHGPVLRRRADWPRWRDPAAIAHTRRWAASAAAPRRSPARRNCAARGYAVTVFDNRPLPGGLNTYGVAEYKLRPPDSLREVEMVRALGVEFRQALVGEAASLDDLEREFDSHFSGLGLGAMQRLGIPGESLHGVIDALRFIERYKTSPDFRVGRRVVVIGGGNTAIDAANAARRLGAEEVHVFYRRTETEMPAFKFEYDHSKVEGVRFHWLAQPVDYRHRRARGGGEVRADAPGRPGRERAPRRRSGARIAISNSPATW